MNLDLDIQNACSRAIPDDADFMRWIEAALDGERDVAEVSLRIVDADEITALNSQYRGKDYATNVLSFPADLPPELELPLLGDIVICAEVVEREASEQHKPVAAHWAHMVVHGTLHLLGYDHIEDDEADHMENREIDILHALSFPNPYEASAGDISIQTLEDDAPPSLEYGTRNHG
jgi:probable rRNA maturation factor